MDTQTDIERKMIARIEEVVGKEAAEAYEDIVNSSDERKQKLSYSPPRIDELDNPARYLQEAFIWGKDSSRGLRFWSSLHLFELGGRE